MKSTNLSSAGPPEVYRAMVGDDSAYQEIVSRCVEAARGWHLREGARVLDACAGAGAFSIPLALALPHCTVIHLEPRQDLFTAARAKAEEAGLPNLEFLQCDLRTANFLPGSMGAIVSVDVLSVATDPQAAVEVLAEWLAPAGWLLACATGNKRRAGWLPALHDLWMRATGGAWLADPAAYRAEFQSAGLVVEDSSGRDPGDSRIVVFRKPDV